MHSWAYYMLRETYPSMSVALLWSNQSRGSWDERGYNSPLRCSTCGIFHLSSLFLVWTTSDDLETWATLTEGYKLKLHQLGLWKSPKYRESYRWFHFRSVWIESLSTFVHHPHVNSQGHCLRTTELDTSLRTSQLPILYLWFGEKGSGFEWTMSGGVSTANLSRSQRALSDYTQNTWNTKE